MAEKYVSYLGKSRKFANGSIHENASGQFMILDRYLEDGTVMLKIQWLNGDKVNEIEENKEININASIHKYQVSRGLTTRPEENKLEAFSPNDVMDKLEYLEEVLENRSNQFKRYDTHIEELRKIIERQSEQIEKLLLHVEDIKTNRQLLENQQGIMSKMLEKM